MGRVVTDNYMASGVHTEIEFPDRVSRSRRFGWGLFVEQAADAHDRHNNWFHIGIPYIQNDRREGGGSVDRLYLQLELNENARLAEVHLRAGRHLAFRTAPGIVGAVVDTEIPVTGAAFTTNPFTVCMRIEFLSGTPIGSVTFVGAGLKLISADEDR